jgi:DNA adenine methylase
MDMIIKAMPPWFGGKRTLAPDIVEQLGKHTQYFEPFCGSYAVLFNKPESQKETVCDLHGDATNLARVVKDEPIAVKLYSRASATQFSEGILHDARDFLQEPYDFETRDPELMLERAYWFFIASWFGRNGSAGTKRIDYQIAVRFTKGGGSPTVRWKNAIESIPAWSRRLHNVVILNRDSFKILGSFEDCRQTAIYCDPPYYHGSRTGYKKGGGEYLHEFRHGLGHRFLRLSTTDVCKFCGATEDEHIPLWAGD